MRVLHVGSGLRPMRGGGIVAYVEDLMDAQVARGDDVAYFFAGRYLPWRARPQLRRAQRRGVRLFEVVSSPLYDHGRQPEGELAQPELEALFASVVREERPDVVHVHEVAGLPTSLIDVAQRAGAPVVVTLQDYFWLCPAFKLVDAEGHACPREVGSDCVATMAADLRDSGLLYAATLRHQLPRHPLIRPLPPRVRERVVERWAQRGAGRALARRSEAARPTGPEAARAFQRRREVNVARLSRADRVIAMSERVAEIHAQLGVDADRISTLPLTLAHIERLSPREPSGRPPVTFGTLAALESVPKGARLLLDAMPMVADAARAGRLRVLVFGAIAPEFSSAAEGIAGLELRGGYRPEELDGLLDEVDVGLMTSVWEEAYGYAGVEFLAKGIPLIANAIGGIVDYAREGETAWLNRSLTADELARLMLHVADRPQELAELSGRVRAARSELVKPMARHADEVDEVYREVAAVAARP